MTEKLKRIAGVFCIFFCLTVCFHLLSVRKMANQSNALKAAYFLNLELTDHFERQLSPAEWRRIAIRQRDTRWNLQNAPHVLPIATSDGSWLHVDSPAISAPMFVALDLPAEVGTSESAWISVNKDGKCKLHVGESAPSPVDLAGCAFQDQFGFQDQFPKDTSLLKNVIVPRR